MVQQLTAESCYYSIMIDKGTDANSMGQLVICIHWVDKEMTVCEEYIGLMPVAKTNADTIVVCIKDLLLRKNIRIKMLVRSAMMDVRP